MKKHTVMYLVMVVQIQLSCISIIHLAEILIYKISFSCQFSHMTKKGARTATAHCIFKTASDNPTTQASL